MASWRKTADNPSALTDEEIAAVLSYARNSWGNKAPMITPEQVSAIAKEEKRPPTVSWSAEELLKVPLTGAPAASAALTPDQLKAALQALPAADLEALLKDVKK